MAEQIIAAVEALEARDAAEAAVLAAGGGVAEEVIEEIILPGAQRLQDPAAPADPAELADPADPAAQGSGDGTPVAVVLSSASAAAHAAQRKVRLELAEHLSTVLGPQCKFDMAMLSLAKDEIHMYALSLDSAPAIFRKRYDPSKEFSWASASFKTVTSSFFAGGVKTPDSVSEICAGPQAALECGEGFHGSLGVGGLHNSV